MTTTDTPRAAARPSLLDAADVLRDAVQANSMFAIGIVHGIASLASGKAAAPPSLEGLRRAIFTPRTVARDQDGMLSHPAVPYLDEDVNYETFFAAFGIEAAFIHMENDVDCDTYDQYFASNSANCSAWTPSAPAGDGWLLLEIYDTEDGPVALYVREKKRESMRERLKREDAEQCALFQSRVRHWMLECFGAEIAADCGERNHRFLEEALELVQACGCTASEAHQLVDYTFGRPTGEPEQEVGGVMVTLAALCLANGLCMHTAGEVELARITVPETVAKIRAKQAAKPKHSPLPGPSAPRTPYAWRDTGALESGDAS
ncbi:hypothetical protein [Burkholderia lata]|uniref:Gp41 n=1 Tax=Burkholderia lata (strain ATCC 17760 / DSM 23089 / LMG 22485 / NCIMB 9086 / R18194 / 383) TaxID=482957 RepID=A0A6P2LES1_BURL3|nr:hypothetical protein [Burkholderia lata]VWB69817.1 gp41 [Burkholderia lata]